MDVSARANNPLRRRLKYWRQIEGADHGEEPTAHIAWFDGHGDTGGKLTSVLLSTNHQTIGSYGAVLLCPQLKRFLPSSHPKNNPDFCL